MIQNLYKKCKIYINFKKISLNFTETLQNFTKKILRKHNKINKLLEVKATRGFNPIYTINKSLYKYLFTLKWCILFVLQLLAFL